MTEVPRSDRLLAEMAALLPVAGEPRAGDEALMARAIEGALRARQAAPITRRRWWPRAATVGAVAATLLLAATAAAYLAPRMPRPMLVPGRVGVRESVSGAQRAMVEAGSAALVARAVAPGAPGSPGDAAGDVEAPSNDAGGVQVAAHAEPGAADPGGGAASAAGSAERVGAAGAVAGTIHGVTETRSGDEETPSVSPCPRGAPSDCAMQTAAQLFAAANTLRRRGEIAAALDGYRRLQSAHPASAEAALSHVSMGRALLDGGGSALEALRAFDAYLAREGPLAEEALVGRALALGRLGRPAEERQAWITLLARFPLSVSAARARARLEELP